MMSFHWSPFLFLHLFCVVFLLMTTGCQTSRLTDQPHTPKTQPALTQPAIDLTPDPEALVGLPERTVKDLGPLRPYLLRTIPVTAFPVFYPMPQGYKTYVYTMKDLISQDTTQIQWHLLDFNDERKRKYFQQPNTIGLYYERVFADQSKSYFVLHPNSVPPMMVMQSEHSLKDRVITYFEQAMLTQPISRKPGDVTTNKMKVVVKDEKTGKVKHTGEMTQTIVYHGMYQLNAQQEVYEVALISSTIDGKVGPATIKNRYHGFHHAERGLMAEVAFEEVSAFLLYNDKTHRVLLFNGEIKE